jgi:hypothetical protein
MGKKAKKKAAPQGKAKSAEDDEDWDSILDAEIKINAEAAKEEGPDLEEEDGATEDYKVQTLHPNIAAAQSCPSPCTWLLD